MPKNTGVGSRVGAPTGRFMEEKKMGGRFGRPYSPWERFVMWSRRWRKRIKGQGGDK